MTTGGLLQTTRLSAGERLLSMSPPATLGTAIRSEILRQDRFHGRQHLRTLGRARRRSRRDTRQREGGDDLGERDVSCRKRVLDDVVLAQLSDLREKEREDQNGGSALW